jgi:hypothetical protein
MILALALGLAAAAVQPPASLTIQTPISTAETAGQRRLEQLVWLAGGWREENRQRPVGEELRVTEELWSLPRRGTMLGLSREVVGQRTRSFEYMRIAVDRDGRLGFYASPGGAPAVRFDVTEASETQLVVTNPAHDYPQRISYRRDGDSLIATISLMDGSRPLSWTYRRQP